MLQHEVQDETRPAPAPDAESRDRSRHGAPGGGRQAQPGPTRILVVEDEPDVMVYVVTVLRAAGYDVLEAPDAGSALATLDSRVGIDLMVTDIRLPGCLDGVDLAVAARHGHPALPILFMSGNPDALQGRRSIAPADAGFIAKPFLPRMLTDRVRALLETGCVAAPAP